MGSTSLRAGNEISAPRHNHRGGAPAFAMRVDAVRSTRRLGGRPVALCERLLAERDRLLPIAW